MHLTQYFLLQELQSCGVTYILQVLQVSEDADLPGELFGNDRYVFELIDWSHFYQVRAAWSGDRRLVKGPNLLWTQRPNIGPQGMNLVNQTERPSDHP